MSALDLVRVALSDGTALHLTASVNALCEFEAVMARSGFDPVRELGRFDNGTPSVSGLRAMVWASAIEQRPSLKLSEIGVLMAHPVDGPKLAAGVLEALKRQQPEPAPEGDDAEK